MDLKYCLEIYLLLSLSHARTGYPFILIPGGAIDIFEQDHQRVMVDPMLLIV